MYYVMTEFSYMIPVVITVIIARILININAELFKKWMREKPFGTVNVNLPGTYTPTYSVADTARNVGTVVRKVIVVEREETPRRDRQARRF